MLALQGKDVLLLNTDRQGTASFWATVRDDTEIEPRIACVQKFGKGLASQVRDLADRYDEIVIDAGGRDGLSVVEWKQDKKAANEMNKLYKEVYGGD